MVMWLYLFAKTVPAMSMLSLAIQHWSLLEIAAPVYRTTNYPKYLKAFIKLIILPLAKMAAVVWGSASPVKSFNTMTVRYGQKVSPVKEVFFTLKFLLPALHKYN